MSEVVKGCLERADRVSQVNGTAWNREDPEAMGLWRVEGGWGQLWWGPRGQDTGGEPAAGVTVPLSASSGTWTLPPGQRKFLFVLRHLKH